MIVILSDRCRQKELITEVHSDSGTESVLTVRSAGRAANDLKLAAFTTTSSTPYASLTHHDVVNVIA
jgi:hypothetical protein